MSPLADYKVDRPEVQERISKGSQLTGTNRTIGLIITLVWHLFPSSRGKPLGPQSQSRWLHQRFVYPARGHDFVADQFLWNCPGQIGLVHLLLCRSAAVAASCTDYDETGHTWDRRRLAGIFGHRFGFTVHHFDNSTDRFRAHETD